MENQHAEHEQLYLHNNQDEEQEDDNILPGYRFVPEDKELIEHYLKVLVSNPGSVQVYGIYAVNLYDSGPDALTAAHKEQCEDKWYFFTKRNRKYTNGKRPNRAAGNGYWKQTNMVKQIYQVGKNGQKVKIGKKITLDYYSKSKSNNGKAKKGSRTDWKMNEYRLDDQNLPNNYSSAGTASELYEWCLCKIYINSQSSRKEKKTRVPLQVASDLRSGTPLISPEEPNEHVAGEQETALEHNGQSAGGPGLNFVQQSTNPAFSNDDYWNPNYSNPFINNTNGSMNDMHYNIDDLLIGQSDIYPINDALYENASYVQPMMSLPPSELPMWSHSNINQSSSSIPGHVTSDWETDFSLSSFAGSGIGESSSDGDFTLWGFDQSGNQNV